MLIPTSQVGVNRGEGLMRTSWYPHGCTSIHSSGWMDVRVDVRACVRVALFPTVPNATPSQRTRETSVGVNRT